LAAIDVLGRLEVADAASLLGPLTASPEPDLARAAIRALGHLSETAVKPILQQLLRADEGWRRVEAVTAVAARGGVEAVSALQWVAAADEAPEVGDRSNRGAGGPGIARPGRGRRRDAGAHLPAGRTGDP
jgi:HEAT repeat protein